MGGALLARCMASQHYIARIITKVVFAAADARQQEFREAVRSAWDEDHDIDMLRLASAADRALYGSEIWHAAHAQHRSPGTRADSCKGSICYDRAAF